MNQKLWGLSPRSQKRHIQGAVEVDYTNRLNKKDKTWLNAFNLAVANGNFTPLAKLRTIVPAKIKKEMNAYRYSAEVCTPNNAQLNRAITPKTKGEQMKTAKELKQMAEQVNVAEKEKENMELLKKVMLGDIEYQAQQGRYNCEFYFVNSRLELLAPFLRDLAEKEYTIASIPEGQTSTKLTISWI